MMGRKDWDQASLFYSFRLDDMIPKGHLLRRIDVFVTAVLGDLHRRAGHWEVARELCEEVGFISPTGGSVGSILRKRFPTTRRSPRTG